MNCLSILPTRHAPRRTPPPCVGRWARHALLLLGTPLLLSATDPRLLEFVKPTAKTVMGINLHNFLATPTMQKLMGSGGQAASLATMEQMVGLNLREDLQEVLLVMNVAEGASKLTGSNKLGSALPEEGLLVLRGKFDKARITGLLNTMNAKPANLAGVTDAFEMPAALGGDKPAPGSKPGAARRAAAPAPTLLAFAADDIILAGSRDDLQQALAARNPATRAALAAKAGVAKAVGTKPVGAKPAKASTLAPAGFLERAAAFGNQMDLWLVSADDFGNVARQASGNKDGAKAGASPFGMLQGGAMDSIQEVAFGVMLQETATAVRLEGLTKTSDDATQLAGMFQFFSGLAQMNSKDPKMADFAPLLQTLKISSNDRTVRMELLFPDGFFLKLLDKGVGQMATGQLGPFGGTAAGADAPGTESSSPAKSESNKSEPAKPADNKPLRGKVLGLENEQ